MIFCFVLFVSVGWLITTYNRFIRYKNRIEEAWSGIDVALKRRFNLIPNLIRAVEGYSEHEAKIFAGQKGLYRRGDRYVWSCCRRRARYPNHFVDF